MSQPHHAHEHRDHPREVGVVATLLDLDIRRYVTPRLLRLVYPLGLAAIGVLVLVAGFSGLWSENPALGLVTLVVAPLVGLLAALLLRVSVEVVAVLFHIADDVARASGSPGASDASAPVRGSRR